MWIIEVVETKVQRAPGGNGYAVRSDRLAVGEENGKCHVGVTIRGVEDARGFVRDELAVGIGAFGGDIALRDRPSPASDRLHALLPFFPPVTITLTTRFSFQSCGNIFRHAA